MTHIQVSISKAKVGPITERYINGEFRTVDRENAMAICGLDNSHNGDYKVAYASDPLLTVTTSDESLTHGDLESLLKRYDLWLEGMNPIEVPSPGDGELWKAGFKSLPRSSGMLDALSITMEKAAERDTDYLEGDNSVHVYLPIE